MVTMMAENGFRKPKMVHLFQRYSDAERCCNTAQRKGWCVLVVRSERPPATPTPIPTRPWKCVHCGYFLGQIANGVLHEGRINKSPLPVVRECPDCRKRNVKLAA